MAIFIPEFLEIAEILAPLVEEGLIPSVQEALGIFQTPEEYVRFIAHNPYVQAVGGAGLLEWEDVKRGVHAWYMHEADKASKRYNYVYTAGGDSESSNKPLSIVPIKLDDKFAEVASTVSMPSQLQLVTRTDDKIGYVPYNDAMSELTDAEYYPIMTELNKWRTKPIVCKHFAKGSHHPGVKSIVLSGYRTQEMVVDPGKMNWNASFNWYSINELTYCHRVAVDNMNIQNGTGFTYLSGQGNTLPMPAETRQETFGIYEMKHKKEYLITNTSNVNCNVILRVMTPKRDTSEVLANASGQGSLYNTVFEVDRTSNAQLRWSSDTDTVLQTPLNTDDYRFNLFRHRYKVRKNWKEIGHRVVNLQPGHTVNIPYMDVGPRMISKIYVDNADGSTLLSGYYKQVFIELRGTDVGWNQSATNYTVGYGGASISVVEKSTIVLKAVPVMRTRKMWFNSTAPTDNSVTAATYHNMALIPAIDYQKREDDDDRGETKMELGGS